VTDRKIEETRTAVRGGAGSPLDDVRIAVRCKVCRQWLTDPLSVALGVGPRCREAT
jgi:hypothetical protein